MRLIDEALLVLGGGGALLGLLPFQLLPLFRLGPRHASKEARLVVLCAYLVSIARAYTARISTESPGTACVRAVCAAALLAASVHVLHVVGLSLRDDALERRNTAALAALVGAIVGLGGALGVAVAQATDLSELALRALILVLVPSMAWWVLQHLGRVHDLVTIDRDEGAGVRAGTLLAGVGLASGRALALSHGSLEAFVLASWPVGLLVVGGGLFERWVAGRSSASSRVLAAPVALVLLLVDLALAVDRAAF
jgi:uncharacterized membrane protein YjfL (UPF0719 family)